MVWNLSYCKATSSWKIGEIHKEMRQSGGNSRMKKNEIKYRTQGNISIIKEKKEAQLSIKDSDGTIRKTEAVSVITEAKVKDFQ